VGGGSLPKTKRGRSGRAATLSKQTTNKQRRRSNKQQTTNRASLREFNMSLFDCCDMIAALQFEASPTLRRRVDCRALTPTTEPKRAMVEADHSISRHILKWETIIDPEDGMRECRAHAVSLAPNKYLLLSQGALGKNN